MEDPLKKHLTFIVGFAEFKHPFKANCRIYALFVDERVLSKKKRKKEWRQTKSQFSFIHESYSLTRKKVDDTHLMSPLPHPKFEVQVDLKGE